MSSIYKTIQGEPWDLIAYRALGNEKYMTNMIEANPEYRDVVFFSADVELVIPDITEPIPTSLPPWKRG